MSTMKRHLLLCINIIREWTAKMALSFLKLCIYFCFLWSLYHDPVLKMDGETIEEVKEVKLLGFTLNNKLSFIPHMKVLRERFFKALVILRFFAKPNGEQNALSSCNFIRLVLIRSLLDYGSTVYGSARKSYIQILETVHHHGLCSESFYENIYLKTGT